MVFSKLSHVKLKDGSFPFSAAGNKKEEMDVLVALMYMLPWQAATAPHPGTPIC